MTPERWQQVKEIFNAALDRPAGERDALLESACGDDPSLRQQVENLLSSHQHAGDFIEAPAALPFDSLLTDEAVTLQLDSMAGRRIGAYKLIREIGRGGMGAVYLAIRVDNQFSQRAAIKLVKRGMDTDFILRRFRNERQILAALNHPNIARLMDGGTTDEGLPYFVMEYIEGLPMHRYCDTHRLTIAERLKMFRQVCDAVAYAHEQKIIHRDIKPGNILVTEDGTAKLLDFGIAKILNPELAADTIDSTLTAMRLMTPEYASPEQARGEAVTDATDQYSLGVLLYELLTGHRPHHIQQRAPHEIARILSEDVPECPSDVVISVRELTASDGQRTITLTPETVSRARNSSPLELRRELEGNLDAIVMQALSKDPRQRYDSVEAFSEDINRHLLGQAILARTCSAKSTPILESADTVSVVQVVAPKQSARKAAIGASVVILLLAIVTVGLYVRSSTNFIFIRPKALKPDQPASISSPIRLTNSLADDNSPQVSPDGTKIVWVSDRNGTAELFLMNLDGSGVRNLTDNTVAERTPAWSPDGRNIAFAIESVPLRKGSIWVMNANGGKPVNLTKSHGYDVRPSYSPDGTRIAFVSNRGNEYKYNLDIWVMKADGSNAHRLTDYAEYDADPTWSPDGKRIAFTRAMPEKKFDILVINADGTNPVNLTHTTQFDEGSPAWSPDGKRIAFASNQGSQNSNSNIWVMNADGSNPHMVTTAIGHNTGPVWTPDGRRLVFQSTRDFNPEIYITDVDNDVVQPSVKNSHLVSWLHFFGETLFDREASSNNRGCHCSNFSTISRSALPRL
ncbi:MAG TPA: protein kinase [Blastocatellia bacterium]|nr:protein kinase [Blastocatellia bacterium]